mmetsp:Transcript_85979/g.148812  ORF Transcript_85979/g.148812 Transcript_85979/m.148812 type:complete len:269 (-) Transcript_85979:420-1226(-)
MTVRRWRWWQRWASHRRRRRRQRRHSLSGPPKIPRRSALRRPAEIKRRPDGVQALYQRCMLSRHVAVRSSICNRREERPITGQLRWKRGALWRLWQGLTRQAEMTTSNGQEWWRRYSSWTSKPLHVGTLVRRLRLTSHASHAGCRQTPVILRLALLLVNAASEIELKTPDSALRPGGPGVRRITSSMPVALTAPGISCCGVGFSKRRRDRVVPVDSCWRTIQRARSARRWRRRCWRSHWAAHIMADDRCQIGDAVIEIVAHSHHLAAQ